MLPNAEISASLRAVDAAESSSAVGRLADGYAALAAGLRRAATAMEAGESWAEEMGHCFQLAIDNY
jgi:hypothetical protein